MVFKAITRPKEGHCQAQGRTELYLTYQNAEWSLHFSLSKERRVLYWYSEMVGSYRLEAKRQSCSLWANIGNDKHICELGGRNAQRDPLSLINTGQRTLLGEKQQQLLPRSEVSLEINYYIRWIADKTGLHSEVNYTFLPFHFCNRSSLIKGVKGSKII